MCIQGETLIKYYLSYKLLTDKPVKYLQFLPAPYMHVLKLYVVALLNRIFLVGHTKWY